MIQNYQHYISIFFLCSTLNLLFFSCAVIFVTSWTVVCQASLSFTISRSLFTLMSIKSVIPSNHLILCPLLFLLPSILPTIRVFSNESALHITWPKNWSFSFTISPSNENSRLIFLQIDWLDLLAVQGTQESSLAPRRSLACCYCVMLFLAVYLCEPYIIPRVLSLLLLQLSVLVPSD